MLATRLGLALGMPMPSVEAIEVCDWLIDHTEDLRTIPPVLLDTTLSEPTLRSVAAGRGRKVLPDSVDRFAYPPGVLRTAL
jgi:hypothetical protein